MTQEPRLDETNRRRAFINGVSSDITASLKTARKRDKRFLAALS
jgi:hypothetical protein